MRDLKRSLIAAWERRRIYLTSNGLSAFRLAGRGELVVPVAVDVYGGQFKGVGGSARLIGGVAVLQLYEEDFDVSKLKSLLDDLFGLEGFYIKRRFRVKEASDAGGDLSADPVEFEVSEYGHRFIVNMNNYLDCGLFLDHRETRRRVETMISGMVALGAANDAADVSDVQFLNLFAYTGAFSVYAAAGGAKTHTVDLSKTYCDWARRNLELNGFSETDHWVYRMDIFEFYKYAGRKGLKFDLIVIDPPTFSRNDGSNFSVQRDHGDLLRGAAALLRDGGQILFSNNCLDFRMDTEIETEFAVNDIQSETIPPDFWEDTIQRDWWKKASGQIHNCYLLSPISSKNTETPH